MKNHVNYIKTEKKKFHVTKTHTKMTYAFMVSCGWRRKYAHNQSTKHTSTRILVRMYISANIVCLNFSSSQNG